MKKNSMKDVALLISGFLILMFAVSCSNSDSESGATCVAFIDPPSDNLSVAKGFHRYRIRCQPTENDLQKEITKLNR